MQEALSVAQAAGNLEGAAWALHGLGRTAHHWRDTGKAIQDLEQSAMLFRQANHDRGLAYSQVWLGSVVQQHDPERAAVLFDESLALLRPPGDTWGLCGVTGLCADFALTRGDARQSATLCQESLTHARSLDSQWMVCYAIWRFARIAISLRDYRRGVLPHAAAQGVGDTIGVPPLPASLVALEDARVHLDPDTYTAAWAIGVALTLEGAISEALAAHPQEESGERST